MKSPSNSELSLKKDLTIRSDCQYLKSRINIDLFSLYIEGPKSVSILSNLPLEIKKSYRNENLSRLDPMLSSNKHGLFMIEKERSPKEIKFNERLEQKFGIRNLYARASSIGSIKISYVLGTYSKKNYFRFDEKIDEVVTKFSKSIVKKYLGEISSEVEEIKISPLVLNSRSIDEKLFKDNIIEKPNYGELCCLSLAKEGLDAREISTLTGYKVSTVHSNLKNVRVKLGARKTIDAAIKAINLGWIS